MMNALLIVVVAFTTSHAANLRTSHGKAVEITTWIGRTGNQLSQLAYALLHAEEAGISEVHLPYAFPGALFSLPLKISLVSPKAKRVVHGGTTCRFPYNAGDFYWKGTQHCAVTLSDKARVLQSYVKPHLADSVKQRCKESRRQLGGLTVHLRSGDALECMGGCPTDAHQWTTNGAPPPWFEFRQPQCALHTDILSGSPKMQSPGFARLLLVSEDNISHPCLKYFVDQGKFNSDDLGSLGQSLEQDVCSLMTAQNIVMSNSLFSKYFVLMNENRPTVFLPLPGNLSTYEGESWDELLQSKQCASTDDVHHVWNIIPLHAPILDSPWPVGQHEEALAWMRIASSEGVNISRAYSSC